MIDREVKDVFKKTRIMKVILISISLAMMMSACGKKKISHDQNHQNEADKKVKSNWTYEKQIKEPIQVLAADEDVILGDLEANKVQVMIPAGTFLEATQVTLINPDTIPSYKEEEMEGLGAPIQISVGEEAVRLLEPVQITMKYDPAMLDENYESGELYIGYYNGSAWQYMKTQVDRDNHTMSFYTSHFSPFGGAKLK